MKTSTVSPKDKLASLLRKLRRYSVPLFLLFLLAIYGFLALRVIMLDQVQPDPSDVTAKLKTAGVPHIDQDVLNKIQQLQDNSVQVQTLFDKARSNPFQE